MLMEAFYYHIAWRSRGGRVGGHPTKITGGHADFNAHVPLMQSFNPKRLDIRASLKTVPKQLMVRTFHERYAIQAYAVVDMSTSMNFIGHQHKWQLSTEIVQAIAWSAISNGDTFGCVGADDTLRMDVYEPSTYRAAVVEDIASKMRSVQFTQPVGINALPSVSELLPVRRSLVFLISDFYMDEALLTQSLQSLAAHDVVPIVIWDSAEITNLPDWGWMRVNDMEGKGTRSVFLRPALKQAIKNTYHMRQQRLTQLFNSAGTRPPFFVLNQFNSEAMTQHMLEDSGC
jgi:uncharacterized protein (DUF58 family)